MQAKLHPKRTLNNSQREAISGYMYVMPAIIGFIAFCAIPIVFSFIISLTDWNVLKAAKFVGFKNYEKLLSGDKQFVQSLSATFKYAIGSTVFSSIYAFLLALLLNTKVRGKAIFRTIFYLPSIVPAVANALLWKWLYNPEFGLFNVILSTLGLPKSNFLAGQNTAIPSLVFMAMWGCGSTMIIYLAGLQGVPKELHEAVDIDGGGYWRKLIHVTIPMVSPVIFFNVLMSLVGSFQVFTQAYMMTQGGPNNRTLFYSYYLYRTAFQQNKMGLACAQGWIMFVIMIAFTAIFFKVFAKKVYSDGGVKK